MVKVRMYNTSIIFPAEDRIVQQASKRSFIGLRPHFDKVPHANRNARSDRLQVFLTGVVGRTTTENNALSRSTVFIPGSQYTPELFIQYWRFYHTVLSKRKFPCQDDKKCIDCEVRSTCPQFFWDFDFPLFQKHYAQLLARHRYPDLAPEGDLDILEHWYAYLPQCELDVLPDKFEMAITNLKNGDLVMFVPGVVHWVLLPRPGEDKILFKAFFELYGHDDTSVDETGFTVSDGGFKKPARLFEKSKLRESQPECAFTNTELYFPLDNEDIVSDLKSLGLSVVSIFQEDDPTFVNDIASYIEFLLDFPEGVSYTDPASHRNPGSVGLEDRHLYRTPGNTRSSIFPKGHGNCGFGGHSKMAHILKERLSGFLAQISEDVLGIRGTIYDVGFGVQGCV
jgi:hypothetical protein